MSPPAASADPRTRALRAALAAWTPGPCAGCARGLCRHDFVASAALGFKDAPRCLGCIAAGLTRPRAELEADLRRYIDRHECFRQTWEDARVAEPGCSWPPHGQGCEAPEASPQALPAPTSESPGRWDAGDMSCGDLVLELRRRLAALPAGATLSLRATDPAAASDLPAWCRMTGHALAAADPPEFLIRRRPDAPRP